MSIDHIGPTSSTLPEVSQSAKFYFYKKAHLDPLEPMCEKCEENQTSSLVPEILSGKYCF